VLQCFPQSVQTNLKQGAQLSSTLFLIHNSSDATLKKGWIHKLKVAVARVGGIRKNTKLYSKNVELIERLRQLNIGIRSLLERMILENLIQKAQESVE
jgi:hypothetical protein